MKHYYLKKCSIEVIEQALIYLPNINNSNQNNITR